MIYAYCILTHTYVNSSSFGKDPNRRHKNVVVTVASLRYFTGTYFIPNYSVLLLSVV